MRKSLLGIVLAATLLPVSLVHAGVKEDLNNGKTVKEIIAATDEKDLEAVLEDFIKNAPDKAYDAIAAAMSSFPSKIDFIQSFAINRGLDKTTIQNLASNAKQNSGLFSGLEGRDGPNTNLSFNTGGNTGGGVRVSPN
ncbi:hypothetical protein [Agitococcus lubricus]|uniref:Uncharacterized protein n=1 Tax=Agitococcus lubricus TaxID=1077255 RepID=A0A2T5J049_9GAMM|nr:hypothetical protein [Agitococcus lubricus]PTQ89722.1 hypothetical protein C8N29_10546 [Agitococcus lubricus]